MSETTTHWIIGGLTGWMTLLSLWVVSLKIELREIRSILILTSKRAADVLHSPDDHFGIDKLLEKYVARDHELTWEEWGRLLKRCEEIHADKDLPKSEQFLAGFLAEVCKHKRKNKLI